jgi:hypothetical protein
VLDQQPRPGEIMYGTYRFHGSYPRLPKVHILEGLMGFGGSWLLRLFGRHTAENEPTIDNPAKVFDKPSDVVNDSKLSDEQKKNALNAWEQDARQLMTASNEGMPGPEEGIDPDDHHGMAEVVRAKDAIGEKPSHKPAH